MTIVALVASQGLAMVIESDFYATDAGRQHFADRMPLPRSYARLLLSLFFLTTMSRLAELTSIRYCVQETANFDALYAYLTCGNCTPQHFQITFVRRYSLFSRLRGRRLQL